MLRGSTGLSQGRGSYVLVARCDDVRPIVNILQALNFIEDACVVIGEGGIKVSVEQARSIQARVFLQSSLFLEYSFVSPEETDNPPPVPHPQAQAEFRINIKTLLECLSIFGGSEQTAMKMYYAGYGQPLTIILEEGGVVTDCSIKTMEPDKQTEIDIRATEIPSNIIMKSSWLADVFAELDMTSELLEIHISPGRPYFRLSTTSQSGVTMIECPKDSDVVESFQCSQTLIFHYKLKLLKPSEKALAKSQKISIRINKWGFLSIQYLVELEDGQPVFIEFLCLPEEDQDRKSVV